VTLTAADDSGVVADTSYALDGGPWTVYAAPFKVRDDGIHRVRFRSRDAAGNMEAERTLDLRIDSTPPTITLTTRPRTLWPADGRMVDVVVDVSVRDGLSGANGFVLKGVESSEPRALRGSSDMEGWEIGTQDAGGQLRAERHKGESVRVYTLTYDGHDQAGNRVRTTIDVRVER